MTSKTTTPANGVAAKAAAQPTAPVTKATTTTTTKKTRKARRDLTLNELAERYIKHLEDSGKSPGTCSSYTAELRLAIKELGGDSKLAAITTEQVGVFFSSKAVTRLRSGRAKAKPSVDKTRRVLRLALVWAAEKKWIGAAPIPEPTTKG